MGEQTSLLYLDLYRTYKTEGSGIITKSRERTTQLLSSTPLLCIKNRKIPDEFKFSAIDNAAWHCGRAVEIKKQSQSITQTYVEHLDTNE